MITTNPSTFALLHYKYMSLPTLNSFSSWITIILAAYWSHICFFLQITKKQCCWSGALRLGFTSKDPSRINPDTLPKYACPDLVSQSGFWAKALPEEFANEGNMIAFWVDKKGRVFYRINESSPMLFFSGVRTAEPLWALIDVYGLTRGVQLLGKRQKPCRWGIWFQIIDTLFRKLQNQCWVIHKKILHNLEDRCSLSSQ